MQVDGATVFADLYPSDELLARFAEVLLAALAVVGQGDVPRALVHGGLELPVLGKLLP